MTIDISKLERIAERRLRIAGLIEKLGEDELAALELCAQGLARGRNVYGELRIDTDGRDFADEAMAELRDTMVYTSAALLRLQRGQRDGGAR